MTTTNTLTIITKMINLNRAPQPAWLGVRVCGMQAILLYDTTVTTTTHTIITIPNTITTTSRRIVNKVAQIYWVI